ncbi:MAG: phage tail tape measure protein [Alistipes sp.]|nr:phage tail tape measure protein [Alistipes sp.]
MAEQNPIRYQDLIAPDDSIEKLIGQLEQLQEVYGKMAEDIKRQASELSASLTKVSGATQQGQKAIKDSNSEAAKLEKAYKQLDFALSQTAKEIARLNAVKREANNYNKQMVLRGKEEIKTMEQIKNASYQQLSAQYSLNKAYLNSLTAADRKIKSNKELIKTTKEIYEQMKRLQADTGKMQLNVGNYPQLGGLLGGLGVRMGGAAAAGLALGKVIKDNVSLATEYEKSLSVLAAILGTTKEGVQDLSEQAQHLGATTVFTAKEVAELQTELAKLGYTTDEIKNMAPAVLNFAQATGSSLADAASLAGAALRMFEKDTTHTTEFVDKMSAATTKSALNFSYLQNAMSTVSPVANAFGFKLEEVLALLGQLANAGFDASSAATATRNILLNLADANGNLAQALGKPVNNLDDLINGLKTLNDRGIDLGESLELTDKRSVAAFNTFLAGTDNVLALRDALADCDGYAKKMADTMADNMEGSLKSLSSAWEGLNLHINQSNGLLRWFVDRLTDAVRWVDKLGQKIDEYFFGDRTADSVFNRLANDYEKQQKKIEEQRKKREEKNKKVTPVGVALGGYKTGQKVTDAQGRKFIADTNGSLVLESEYKAPKGGSGGKGGRGGGNTANQQLKEQEQAEKESLKLRRAYDDAMLELIEDEEVKERTKIVQKYDREIEDLQAQLEKRKETGKLSIEDEKLYNDQIVALEQVKQYKLAALTEKQAEKEKQANEKKKREEEQAAQRSVRERERAIELEYQTDMEGIEQLEDSEKIKTQKRLEAEKKRLEALLKLYEADGKKLGEAEIALIKKQIEGVDKEIEKNKKTGDIYDLLGFNLSDEKKEAIDTSLSYAMDGLNQFISAYAEAADKKRQLADAEVERTQNVLQAEIEARSKGYANEVETARKEVEEAKKNQQKAIEQQKRAQRLQIALDTASQAANLITASSLIWKQLGFPWAIPALAVMWGSFAAAKVKAIQAVGAGTEKYAEGTVELLEGGSHQSGHDIDLGTKRDGTRRRAEGGEFFAVINKRNSRKYRREIPEVIGSLNNGTFAEKYLNAYDGANININAPEQKSNDLTALSNDVRSIREQGERMTYVDGQGRTIEVYKNVKRILKN